MKPGLLTGAALLTLLLVANPAALAERKHQEDRQVSKGHKSTQPATPRASNPQPRSRPAPAPTPRNYTPMTPKRDFRNTMPRGDSRRSGLPVIQHSNGPAKDSHGRDAFAQRTQPRPNDNNGGNRNTRNRNPNPGNTGNYGRDYRREPHPDFRGPTYPRPGFNANSGHDSNRNGHGNGGNRNNNGGHDSRNRDHNGHGDYNRNDRYRNDHRYNDHDRNRHDYRRNNRWPNYTYWVDPWYSYPGPYYDYYGSGVRFSFFGGYGYQPGWSLYPWWYGDDYWGYRTRSGYRPGYGHIGHSNVYCTDPTHATYGDSWRYDDNYFSMYSEWTDGAHGGYNIQDCHMENARGTFARSPAMVRETVCWDEGRQAYVATGAVQLISYF